MRLRRLRWWDVVDLYRVERDIFGTDGWTEATFWSELAQHRTRHYLVADDDGIVAGYAGLAAVGEEAFVQTIGVARSHWGRGVGTALLTALLAEADRRGASRVLLEVRADNARAQALYRRFGFGQVGRRRSYYQPSGTDAVVMRRG